jgi:hypothetical protein
VKANAKGILASTMKQELNDLLKEQEDVNPDEEEKDVDGVDAPEDVNEPSITDDEPKLDDEPSDDVPDGLNMADAMDDGLATDDDADDVLDMTGASEDEVLKVFKAMKPEDGIVVKKDGDTVQFSDEGNDYIIKLDGEESPEETPELPSDGLEPELPSDGLEDPELPEGLAEQDIATNDPATDPDEVVYEIELDEDENDPFSEKVKKSEAKEDVNVTDTVGDGDPFDKKSEAQVGKGVKKLQANEQEGTKRPGTPVPGTGSPTTKEPGKGGTKTTQAEPFEGTPVKGTKPAEKKEPGKGGTNAEQVEDHPGTPPKGTGNPVMKEPKEGMEECDECGDGEVKEVEATESVRTKGFPQGDNPKDGPDRAGLPSKKVFKAGAVGKRVTGINEEVETLRKQNGEYKKALLLFKDKLNEVAMFNANLAYATRLFTEHSTTKQEKLNILKRFDSVSTMTESKSLYSTIDGELGSGKPITETVAEKIVTTPQSSSTEVLSEAKAYENPQFKRMKDLMNKIK